MAFYICHGKKTSVNLTTVRFTTIGGELKLEIIWILPYLHTETEHGTAGKKHTDSVPRCNHR